VDVLEFLEQLGQVEPVDQAVLDAALHKLAESGEQGSGRRVRPGRRATSQRGRVIAAAAAAALTVAAAFAAVTGVWRPVPVPGSGGSHPHARERSRGVPGVSVVPTRGTSAGSPAVAAVLTAFDASSNDILRVTKIVRGEGTCCRTIMWISPAAPASGTNVQSRILTFTLSGSRLSDMALAYTAPQSAPAIAGATCGGIFGRPRVAPSSAEGSPGKLTAVNYLSRMWLQSDVRVEPATLPSAAALRACLMAGQWHYAGHGLPGGAKAIEFVRAQGSERLWVSAATFLPVRMVYATTTPYGQVIISFDFEFLRPTTGSQAMLAVTVPGGFTRTSI
jgi:hypothetical protein